MPSTKKPSASSGRPRRYTEEQKRIVARLYPTCRTQEEKLALCEKVGIASIRRLYNLASQMGLTRSSEDLSDREFQEFMQGNHAIMSQRRRYDPQEERELLMQRQDPRAVTFTEEDDKYIIDNFGRLAIGAIAAQRGHTETAIMYRARQLRRQDRNDAGELMPERPLRRAAVGFSLERVLIWLGLSDQEASALQAAGVDIRPLPNPQGEIEEQWVIARSLAPFLRKYGARLIKDKNADKFFIKEILETEEILKAAEAKHTDVIAKAEQLAQMKMDLEAPNFDSEEEHEAHLDACKQIEEQLAEMLSPLKEAGVVGESCYFLDHGHKCRNPYTGPCYKLFCDGEDSLCYEQDRHHELQFGGNPDATELLVLG